MENITQQKHYLVIIGDQGNRHYVQMKERLGKLGVSQKLLDNMYLLTATTGDPNCIDMEHVRNYIAGKEFGYCFVITMNKALSCAWSLTGSTSTHFAETVKKIKDESK